MAFLNSKKVTRLFKLPNYKQIDFRIYNNQTNLEIKIRDKNTISLENIIDYLKNPDYYVIIYDNDKEGLMELLKYLGQNLTMQPPRLKQLEYDSQRTYNGGIRHFVVTKNSISESEGDNSVDQTKLIDGFSMGQNSTTDCPITAFLNLIWVMYKLNYPYLRESLEQMYEIFRKNPFYLLLDTSGNCMPAIEEDTFDFISSRNFTSLEKMRSIQSQFDNYPIVQESDLRPSSEKLTYRILKNKKTTEFPFFSFQHILQLCNPPKLSLFGNKIEPATGYDSESFFKLFTKRGPLVVSSTGPWFSASTPHCYCILDYEDLFECKRINPQNNREETIPLPRHLRGRWYYVLVPTQRNYFFAYIHEEDLVRDIRLVAWLPTPLKFPTFYFEGYMHQIKEKK
jgi:hypothetical protein